MYYYTYGTILRIDLIKFQNKEIILVINNSKYLFTKPGFVKPVSKLSSLYSM